MGKDKIIKIIQCNLQNARAVTGEIIKLLVENRFDIALVQEPYVLKAGTKFRIPALNGMKCVAEDTSNFLAAILYNPHRINALAIPQIMTPKVSVMTITNGGKDYVYASVYIPPSEDIRMEIPAIRNVIMETQGKRICIGGDFNARSTTWFDVKDDNRAPMVEELLMEANLTLMNRPGFPPTFETANGSSRVDLTLATENLENEVANWKVDRDLLTSDHNAIAFEVGTPRCQKDRETIEYKIDLSQLTAEKIGQEICDIVRTIEQEIPEITTPHQIDTAINQLQEGIRSCVMRKGTRRRRYGNRPDWWTDEVERFRRVYMETKKIFYKNRHSEYSDHLHEKMTRAKDRFKHKLDLARKRSWSRFAEEELKKNPWGTIYKMAAEKFHKAGVLSCFQREDGTITTSLEETMNHLVNVLLPDDEPGTNDNVQNMEQRDYNALIPTSQEPAEMEDAFSYEDLEAIIGSLQPNKAPGTDAIKGSVVKLIHQWTGPLLLKIYNACWKCSYFPTEWKQGNLVILLKDPTGHISNSNNYRPIVLLPAYGKILEKLIKVRIKREVTPLHSEAQYGFVSGRSTTDALLRYKNRIKESNSKYVMTIFVDIKGAFDNAWWPAILRCLRNRNCSHNLNLMIKSYLTDREVALTQGNTTVRKKVTKGCPQGSVLGPDLWDFILDPLLDEQWPEGVTPIAYADDLAIVVEETRRKEFADTAQEVLDRIQAWARRNKLELSPSKTVYLINKSPPRQHHRDIRLTMGSNKVNQVTHHKYLGLIIDPKLNFEKNAAYATTKTRRLAMALRQKASRYWGQSTEAAIRTIYKGALLPILRYGSSVWIDRMKYSKVRRKYTSIHGTMARVISQSYSSVSTDAAGVIAGILPTDLELEKAHCLSELRRGRCANFQDEDITPGQFDSARHAAEYLTLKAEDTWQERWDSSTKGRITYDFIPEVTQDNTALPKISSARTQVITGHGGFGCHMLRIGKSETDSCIECQGERDDPQHRILRCPRYRSAQMTIEDTIGTWPPNLRDVPFLEDDEIFKQLAEPEPSNPAM